jgi:hypothetical protein
MKIEEQTGTVPWLLIQSILNINLKNPLRV